MIRVLHAISDANIGGAGVQMLALLSGLCRREFELMAVVPEGSLLLPRILETGVRCAEAPHLASRTFSARAVLPLRRQIKAFAPDIVHAHAAMSARVAARLCGRCRIVNTRHSVFPPTGRQLLMRPLAGAVDRLLGDAVIAVSGAARDNLARLGIAGPRVRVVHNGVDTAKFAFSQAMRDEARAELGAGGPDLLLGHAGRFSPEKNHFFLLEVLRAVRGMEGYGNARLALAGTGPLLDEARRRADGMGLRAAALFLGQRDDMARLYSAFDVFLMPSAAEGFGLAAAEAQCSGLPCILSDAVPRAVDCGGSVFLPPVSPEFWAAAVASAARAGPGFRADGARRVTDSGLDCRTMCRGTAEVYRRLMSMSG